MRKLGGSGLDQWALTKRRITVVCRRYNFVIAGKNYMPIRRYEFGCGVKSTFGRRQFAFKFWPRLSVTMWCVNVRDQDTMYWRFDVRAFAEVVR
jgi:hypothetical protein